MSVRWDRQAKVVFWLTVIVMAATLSSCGAATAVETRVQIERVPVPTPCPDDKTYDGLVADQPVPLRNQAMPGSADERVARTAAQLGRYEAKGGWADRARAALDRCHSAGG